MYAEKCPNNLGDPAGSGKVAEWLCMDREPAFLRRLTQTYTNMGLLTVTISVGWNDRNERKADGR